MATRRIDERIKDLGGWRGQILARVRTLIRQAEPDVVEEWKWSVPVWSLAGIICTGEAYKKSVKLTFPKGASLDDPSGLFNASLGGNTRRAIDLHEGEKINATAFKSLIRAAAALNAAKPGEAARASSGPRARASAKGSRRGGPALLSGGNPQIAKAYGDAPVQAYIAAMPGWKRDVGRRLDSLIGRAVPGVVKAVKWNSPFFGVDGGAGPRTWFLSIHCFTKYIKVAFFRGASLNPPPPGASKQKEVRYLNIEEGWGSERDEAQFVRWVRQASRLPGERM